MSADEFKVKIENGIMFVRNVNLCPSVFLVHTKAMENVTAKYPICRVVCKTVTVPSGFRDVSHKSYFPENCPRES